jgi:hypothetical protein
MLLLEMRTFGVSSAGLALLLLAGGCSGTGSSGSDMNSEGVQATARTLDSLRRFHADDAEMGRVSVSEARKIALDALDPTGRATDIWDEPTFVVDGCYFFTIKDKLRYRLSGVLVHAESGDAAPVLGTLYVGR